MTTTRTRILDASTELFRRQGMSGTGLKQIAESAKAPFGSIYHFFPGGKDDLAGQTIRRAGGEYRDLVMAFFVDPDGPDSLVDSVATAFTAAGQVLEATDYADACPIATVALEVASTNETLRTATAEVFTDWIEVGAAHIERYRVPHEDARRLIIGFITSLEGAFVLARALRSTEPLEAASRNVQASVREALGLRPPQP